MEDCSCLCTLGGAIQVIIIVIIVGAASLGGGVVKVTCEEDIGILEEWSPVWSVYIKVLAITPQCIPQSMIKPIFNANLLCLT